MSKDYEPKNPLPLANGKTLKTGKQIRKGSERQKFKTRNKIAAYKRAQKKLEAKLEKIKADERLALAPTAVVDTEQLARVEPTVADNLANREVIFKPNDGPQTDFLAASEQELLYGGAAGGGKSYALLVDPLRYCGNRSHNGILFRRTNDELRELIWKSKELYPRVYPGAVFREKQSTWEFPSGAHHWFTYLDRDEDVLRYQGQAFNWIGFDELTQWPTPFAWDYMRSRLRTADSSLPLFQRATTNPGGPGAHWVKRMFIDPAPWGSPFWGRDLETDQVLVFPPSHKRAGEPVLQRRFIPAKLTDNPYLYQDGRYESNLLTLPESQRRQLLEGDWDSFDGAAFPEFRRSIHVIEPFTIPNTWIRFRGADWGYSSPGCVLWFAVDYDQNLVVYREYYHKKQTADQVGAQIRELEKNEQIRYGVLDSSTWNKRGDTGPSIAEQLNLAGCKYRPADRSPGSRVSGKNEVHRRLALGPTGEPRVRIFNTCTNLIRTLPLLPIDKNAPEDVDTDAEDHAYDAFRYGCASRPINKGFLFSNANPTKRPGFQPADKVFGY